MSIFRFVRTHKQMGRLNGAVVFVFCAISSLSVHSKGCAIPVFRYALEQWMPDHYHLQIYHREPLRPAHQGILSALTGSENVKPAPVNLRLELRADDLPSDLDPFLARGPVLSIHSPGGGRSASPLWIGPLSEPIVRRILQSPGRSTIQERILSGQTAVFLYLRTGDADQDAQSYRRLEDALRHAEQTLDLESFEAAVGRDLDTIVPSNAPPLKVAFSALDVARRDPAEMFLVTPILRSLPERIHPTVPVVVPIFARGRALPPLVGDQITPEAILGICRFLINACSCEVKEQNPGLDLLFTSDWGGDWPALDYQERELPPLEGVLNPDLAAKHTPAIAPPPATPAKTTLPVRALLLALGVVGAAIALATGWLIRRGKHPPGSST